LLLGIVGPSGTGKTYSALRLATGIQRIEPGEIFLIDTEARRSLHYAENFKFRHVAFGAPFGPLDYLDAIDHCVKKGAKIIIVDSMSHEHEGPGGVLEMHAAETERLAKAWRCSHDVAQMSAWNKPKSERRRMINTILQIPTHFIFCFRAKEKMLIKKGEQPVSKGFEALAGQEFIYELLLKFLLLPGARGTPTWQSEMLAEKQLVKIPGQFDKLFARPEQLSEDIGAELARWAQGAAAVAPVGFADLVKRYEACSDPSTYRVVAADAKASWSTLSADEKKALKAKAEDTMARIKKAAEAPRSAPGPDGPPGDEPPHYEPPHDPGDHEPGVSADGEPT
jgi:ABC-type dipeptide/oligopeptide/nickel transport system ATPase subunit